MLNMMNADLKVISDSLSVINELKFDPVLSKFDISRMIDDLSDKDSDQAIIEELKSLIRRKQEIDYQKKRITIQQLEYLIETRERKVFKSIALSLETLIPLEGN